MNWHPSSTISLTERIDNVPEELSDSVTLLFGKDHLWNWQRVIDVLGILTMSLRDNVKPSYIDAVNKQYSKAEVTLLDCIYEHYAPSNGSNYFVNPPKPSGYSPKSLRSTATVASTEKTSESPQDASETSEGADAFSEGETLRKDSAKGDE